MTQHAGTTTDKIFTPARAAAEAVEERVGEIRERAEGLYRQSKRKAIELEGEFEDYVKVHPVKSVLVAAGVGAGVGLLLGMLLARR